MSTSELAHLVTAFERHAGHDGVHETAISALVLSRRSTPSDHSAVVYEPSLCLVVQGAKEVLLEGERYRYDPAQMLLVSVDLPVTARVVDATPERPCLAVKIGLSTALVGELVAAGAPVATAPPARGMAVAPAEAPLLDAVSRLIRLLDSPADVAVLGPLALREIVYRVLTGPLGPRLRQLAAAGAPTQRVAAAIRELRDKFAAPLSIEALAQQARLSPSAFHRHFKSVTAMSPLQFQKRLRLQEARRLMLGEGLDAGEAAFRVGYESPSQFSREYRRLFGAPPRQDVTALQLGALTVADRPR